ncbi:HEAT repeat domain-containing protein [Kitasatospora sp. NPDC101183]|uniref:HEAT repeat domain-containing protein n=1 Tax=Kitasatospora sp. NPDC101183 TaxID=3364100 RepID=UPI00381D712A
MTDSSSDLADRLASAVTARDARAVQALLEEEGAPPDAPGPDGLPLLCTAVAGFAPLTAAALVEAGADQDRALPDGSTPLLRAVDSGSPALVTATLGKAPRLRLPEASRRRLLDLARHWHETGAAEELGYRTGAAGPAVRRRIDDPDGDAIEEVSLGGRTVRNGHGAILTYLEWEFGVIPPVAEVVSRTLPQAQEDDSTWHTAAHTLSRRLGPRVRSELAALRHHPDPVHRRFAASVLWHRGLLVTVDRVSDVAPDADFLASWARDEADGETLAAVLNAYNLHDHPAQEAVGLPHLTHPDPRVRSEAVFCASAEQTARGDAATSALLALVHDPTPDVRAAVAQALAVRFTADGRLAPAHRDALILLLRDDTSHVRRHAARSLSHSDDRATPTMDALLALLDEDDADLRLEAAAALAHRDDPRTAEACARVGPLDAFPDHDPRLFALWRYGTGPVR